MNISVREMEKGDIELIVDYFSKADAAFLNGMGADKRKLPDRTDWIRKLNRAFEAPMAEKEIYYVIWMIDGRAAGHSNIDKINFGSNARMHLHLWDGSTRKKGLGLELVKQSIPYYFKHFELEKLICEPYAENAAPNRLLKKVGFELVRQYETVPGWISYHQAVNRYEITKDWLEIQG